MYAQGGYILIDLKLTTNQVSCKYTRRILGNWYGLVYTASVSHLIRAIYQFSAVRRNDK